MRRNSYYNMVRNANLGESVCLEGEGGTRLTVLVTEEIKECVSVSSLDLLELPQAKIFSQFEENIKMWTSEHPDQKWTNVMLWFASTLLHADHQNSTSRRAGLAFHNLDQLLETIQDRGMAVAALKRYTGLSVLLDQEIKLLLEDAEKPIISTYFGYLRRLRFTVRDEKPRVPACPFCMKSDNLKIGVRVASGDTVRSTYICTRCSQRPDYMEMTHYRPHVPEWDDPRMGKTIDLLEEKLMLETIHS